MDTAHAALLILVLLVAGCTAGMPGSGATPTATVPPTSTENASCVDEVAFWGLGGTEGDLWTRDTVRIGYTLPPSNSALFVVFENDTVLGWTSVENSDPDNAIASDGDPIDLTTELHGTHTLRVAVYRDVNGNDMFDAATDEPCTRTGEIVQAGPETIDFD